MGKQDAADILQGQGADGVRDAIASAITNGKTTIKIADIHKIFQKWFGQDYDLDTINATLAVAAIEKFPGDPPWLLIISGPGNAKTETVQSVKDVPDTHVISTITSEGALLSASPKKARRNKATGGLLRKIGAHGTLVIKDFTSIITADRNLRNPVLAGLREVHDGFWSRNVGSDGGQTISWEGRIIVIAACTTAWDSAHNVIAQMGDRFVVLRSSSDDGRESAAINAINNTGREAELRKEIATAVAALMASIVPQQYALQPDELNCLVKAANLVTKARTAVETDYRGNVIDAHAPEMPTRFTKELTQIFRGALAIGLSREKAFALVMRCARDSIPPLRLAVLRDLDKNELNDCRVADVAKRLEKPWTTIDRTLQALHVLQLAKCIYVDKKSGEEKTVRHYTLASSVRLDVLVASVCAIRPGDYVQWTNNKFAIQFPPPGARVIKVDVQAGYAFVDFEGSQTGIPIDELTVVT